MHLEVIAEPELSTVGIRLLDQSIQYVKNNSEIQVNDWFELVVDYPGYHVDIQDVLINHESIKYCVYTGTFTQKKDNVTHYCPSLWEAGKFTLWLHPNLGHYFMSMFSQINNGDFGKDLSKLYLCTVDRPIIINSGHPEHVKSYFAKGYGPRWWDKKDIVNLPYKVLQINHVDKNQLLNELKQLPHKQKYKGGWNSITYKKRSEIRLPGVEFSKISQWPEIVKTLQAAGYTSMINVNWLGLDIAHSVRVHRDDMQNIHDMDHSEAQHFIGCVRFYWSLVHSEGFRFKMGEAGLLPIDQPLLLNATQHAHCVINDGVCERQAMQAWGIF